jgi:hypothetical protein
MPLIRLVSNSRLTLSIKEKKIIETGKRGEKERESFLWRRCQHLARGGFQFGFCGDFEVLN